MSGRDSGERGGVGGVGRVGGAGGAGAFEPVAVLAAWARLEWAWAALWAASAVVVFSGVWVSSSEFMLLAMVGAAVACGWAFRAAVALMVLCGRRGSGWAWARFLCGWVFTGLCLLAGVWSWRSEADLLRRLEWSEGALLRAAEGVRDGSRPNPRWAGLFGIEGAWADGRGVVYLRMGRAQLLHAPDGPTPEEPDSASFPEATVTPIWGPWYRRTPFW